MTIASVVTAVAMVLSSATVAQAGQSPSLQDTEATQDVEPTAEATSTQSPGPTGETSPGPSEPAVPDDRRSVSPQSVPSATGDDAVITVSVGGTRTGNSTVGSLAGVELQLYGGGSTGPTTPVNESWATCTSDADGDCSFTVPKAGCDQEFFGCWDPQANYDRRFWVVQESVPSGWYANDELYVGSTDRGYRFRTGDRLRAGKTYESGDEFMGSGSNGTWQSSLNNNRLQLTCSAGLDVALVLDLSGSVANAGAEDDLKEAAKGMVDALDGTGSSMALYTFAAEAPRNTSADGKNWPAADIDSHADDIKDHIDDYRSGGGTNWDRGLWQVAQPGQPDYDLVVVITDGQPTYYGDKKGSGGSTSYSEVEEAIFSANAIKANDHTRMLAVGVGDGITSGSANLAAISGPNRFTAGASINDADYVQSGWNDLKGLLTKVAQGATCQADITVTKKTLAYGASEPQDGGAGWTFQVASDGGTLSPTTAQTTDVDSTVNYRVKYDDVDDESTVRIAEVLTAAQTNDGWRLDSVSCTVNDTDVPVDSTDVAVTAGSGDVVACTVVNAQTLTPGVSIIKKAWNTSSGPVPDGTDEIAAGSTVADGTTITWTYIVTNTGRTPLTDVVVGDDRLAADAVTCPSSSLDVGASMTCYASGPVTP